MLENSLLIIILGYLWNMIIGIKNLSDVFAHSNNRTWIRLNHFDFGKVLFNKWYIPFYTLITYKPFLPWYYEYKKTAFRADTVDFCYYLSLENYKSLKKENNEKHDNND